MPKIIYLTPFGTKTDLSTGRMIDFDPIYKAVKSTLLSKIPGIEVYRHDEVSAPIIDVYAPIDEADLVICDITTHNANCLYEFGYAHGKAKPTVLITARSGPIPFDLNRFQLAAYDPENIADFLPTITSTVELALKNPHSFTVEGTPSASPRKVFVSYSHKDKEFLDRMLVHLKPLEAAGLIDPWVDTRLRAGDRWKTQIETALQSASVAILLVSADFLASDFIVKNELPPMLAKAERDGTRIIPIILKHCRFSRDPSLSVFQSHNSPDQPLSTLDDSECERIFDQLAQTLEDSLHSG